MSSATITYIVWAGAAVFSLTAFIAWVLVPAWKAYDNGWQRAAAVFLSFYVLLAMVGAGIGAGVLVVYFWDRIG